MITIYGWDESDFRCVPCLKAKRLAEVKGYEFEFKALAKNNITPTHDANMRELKDMLYKAGVDLKTLPMIFDGDRLIGGFTELKEESKK